jgi:PAS domain S-box-containing protein
MAATVSTGSYQNGGVENMTDNFSIILLLSILCISCVLIPVWLLYRNIKRSKIVEAELIQSRVNLENIIYKRTIELEAKNEELEKQLLIRKQIEADLHKAAIIMNRMPDAVDWISKDSKFLYANDASCKMRGFSREEFLTMSVSDVVPEYPRDIWDSHWDDLKREGSMHFETVSRNRDGREFPVEVTANYINIDGVEYNCAIVRDITDRKRSEDSLKKSAYFFKESQRSALIGSYHADFIIGKWESSEVLDQIFGIDKDYDRSIQGWLDIVHPDDRDLMDRYLMEEVISNQKPFSKEYRIIRKNDGETRWVNGRGSATFDTEGNLKSLMGTIQDITENKMAVEALRASEEKFRSYIAFSSHGICVVDEKGNYIDVNPAASTITGFTTDELLTMKIPDLLPPESLEWGASSFKQVTEAGYYCGESAFKKKNGDIGYWSLSAVKLSHDRLMGIVTDITDRKLTEKALRDSEEKYRHTIENAPIGIYRRELDGKFHFVNKNILQQFECKTEEEFYANYSHISGCHAYSEKNEDFEALLVKNGKVLGYDVQVPLISGTLKIFSIYAFLDETNSLVNGFVLDVTEQKHLQNEQQQLEKQLLHAQKLESLGVLAGGIAHDFNNILMSIIGNADLALMRVNPESPGVDNLHNIENAAARAADLAKQMLAYSGRGKFVVEHLDLNHLLEDMLHMLQVSISKKAVLRLNLHQNLPSIEADATQMRQIIMNLVINASESIDDKSGVIAITTGCMDCDKNYLKDIWLNENITAGLYIYLEIADSGCGMTKETMAKLFDPFFTTKFQGRGLGMAAVLGIVRGHKGAIKVYSELNKGTSFKILLPASNRPNQIFNGESHKEHWQGDGTVLLVDDEETVRGIGKEMLQQLGFTTITANDGREAIDIFKTTPEISLVILDLTMPHIDGEQCFRELRRINPDVKVIMSSGYNEQEVTQKFVGKGLAGFIQKPYKLSTLKETIRKISET